MKKQFLLMSSTGWQKRMNNFTKMSEMNMQSEFQKFATRHMGVNSMVLHGVTSTIQDSLTPYIIEERRLNVATMDVFSRLMMDRIIFLGTAIDDYVSSVIQAQLLFLDS